MPLYLGTRIALHRVAVLIKADAPAALLEGVVSLPEHASGNKMNPKPTNGNETMGIAAGGAGGLVCGAVMGAGVASMLGSPSGMVWTLLILHTGIAMMAMGAWVTPSLLSGGGIDEGANIDKPHTGA